MRKIGILFTIIYLTGCSISSDSRPVSLDVYIVEGCGYCDTFKQEADSYLHRHFTSLTINYLDLDDEEILIQYDELTEQLDGFEEDDYKSTPLIVYSNYFAVSGYEAGDEKALCQDIECVLDGEKLGDQLAPYRFTFKEVQDE